MRSAMRYLAGVSCRRALACLGLLVLLSAGVHCGPPSGSDGGVDSGRDAGRDAGPDGGDAGPSDAGDGGDGGDGGIEPPPATWSWIDENILPGCAASNRCHVGPPSMAPLDLRTGRGYAQLVGQPSIEVPNWDRVVPGDPEASYFYLKLLDRQAEACQAEGLPAVQCGRQMPSCQNCMLSERLIDTVRRWIEAGAPND